MSIEGQGHFFTIYFPGFVCFMLYLDKISGERLQDHWSSGLIFWFTSFLYKVSIQGGINIAISRFLSIRRVLMETTAYEWISLSIWLFGSMQWKLSLIKRFDFVCQ